MSRAERLLDLMQVLRRHRHAMSGTALAAELGISIRTLYRVYRDEKWRESTRTMGPFALGFFDQARVVVAWCELRYAIRHFRADRIAALTTTGVRYPRRRQALRKR